MIKLIILMIFSIVMSAHADTPNIQLTKENLVNLSEPVSELSMSRVISELEKNKSNPVYLYIKSGGGDVIAGFKLINYLKLSNKNVHCVAEYAASMAHAILEACPVRIGTPINILMQHKISVASPEPQTITEIESNLKILRGLEDELTALETKRIGISVAEFVRRTFLPWVTFGKESLTENLIDKIATVTCSSELYSKVSSRTGLSPIGRITVTQSACPLLSLSVALAE